MKYVVTGAGGTGGILSAALYKAGCDISVIARGKHLEKIKENGLVIRDMQSGEEESFRVPAFSEEEFSGTADVIFVCVKGYSLPQIVPFLDRISSAESVIIPVLNIFTTGETLRQQLPGKYVTDGCIYVSANIAEPGVILQHSRILRVIYGAAAGQEKRAVLADLKEELDATEIRAVLSENIRRDSMKKFCYVSPVGAAGLYYNATAGDFKKEGEKRDMFIGLMKEVEALAEKMGCPFDTDVISYNLDILDHQPDEVTTSLQRDVRDGKPSEIKGLIFDIPELGRKYGIEMPLYAKVTAKFS